MKNLVKKGAHKEPKDRESAIRIAMQKLDNISDDDQIYRKNLERCIFIIENWDDESKQTRKQADDWTNMRTIDESHVK